MAFDQSNPTHVNKIIIEFVTALKALEESRATSKRVKTIIARNDIDFTGGVFPDGFNITPAQMLSAQGVLDALETIFDANITPAVQESIDDILLNIGNLVGTG